MENGRSIKRELSNAYPLEQLTQLICPFDNTQILRWHDGHGGKGYSCPNCNIDYVVSSGTQEQINNYFEQYLQNINQEIIQLTEKKNDLEFFLSHVEKIQNNQANLSAKNIPKL